MEVFYMSMLKCPNCGQVYNDGNTYYCLRCNIKLKPINQVTEIKNPQLTDVSHRAVGSTSPTTNPQYVPKCPTCGSPNVEKISLTSKVVGGALFGLFSSNVRKTMHCKNCGYKW